MGLKLDAAEAAVRNQAVGAGRPADKPAKGDFRNRQVRELQDGAQPERSIAQSLKEKSAVGPANPGEPAEKGARRGWFKSAVSKAVSSFPSRRRSTGGTTLPGMLNPLEDFESHKAMKDKATRELVSALPSLNESPPRGLGTQLRHRQAPSTRLGPPPGVPTEHSPQQLSAVVPRKGGASKLQGASRRPERSPANQQPSLEEKARRKPAAIEKQRLADRPHSSQLSPADGNGHFRAEPPGAPREWVYLTNRDVPGSALGERFPRATALDRQAVEIASQYKQPPHLTRTVLRESSGRAIWSGLRHGAIVPKIASIDWYRETTDAEQLQALQDLLPDDHPYHTGQDYSEEEINRLLPGFRSLDAFHTWRRQDTLDSNRRTMNIQAARNMARKVAATALAADPERLQQALAMQPVCLKLFHVVLIPARREDGWPDHQNAFAALERDSPVPLQVRGADGRPQTVRVDIKLRHFTCSRKYGLYHNFRTDEEPYSQLLGAPGSSKELGGDVEAKIEELNDASEEIYSNVRTLKMDLKRLDRSSQRDVVRKKIQTLKGELSRIQKHELTLWSAGEELKTIRDWELAARKLGRSTDYPEWDMCEHLGARLGLVAHLLGETPILTACESGAAETLHLDAAVKFLAMITSEEGGYVPDVWDQREPLSVRDYKSFRTTIGVESEPGGG